MSCIMRDSSFSLGENKEADQLCSDLWLCFRYRESTILFFINLKIQMSKLNQDTIRKVENTPMQIYS